MPRLREKAGNNEFVNQAAFNVWSLCISGLSALISLGVGIIVYWYTRETQRLRKATEAQVEQLKRPFEEQERRRPVLTARVTLRTSPVVVNQAGSALACYVTFTLTNSGLSSALKCQPVLTMMYEKHVQPTGAVTWRPAASWIPLPLLWSLDESNRTKGTPTQDRDLVPRRPYHFDLGGCSTQSPDDFSLTATSYPYGQPTIFPPKQLCFEVTVFSENAEPLKKWIRVNWMGRFVLLSDRLDFEYLRNPPHEMMQRIDLQELHRDPSQDS